MIQKDAENILRYGKIVCILKNDTEKYYIVNFKKDCYEVEKILGNIVSIKKYKNSKPKYYDIQLNLKTNLIKNNL